MLVCTKHENESIHEDRTSHIEICQHWVEGKDYCGLDPKISCKRGTQFLEFIAD
jgi:hypothetical protein